MFFVLGFCTAVLLPPLARWALRAWDRPLPSAVERADMIDALRLHQLGVELSEQTDPDDDYPRAVPYTPQRGDVIELRSTL